MNPLLKLTLPSQRAAKKPNGLSQQQQAAITSRPDHVSTPVTSRPPVAGSSAKSSSMLDLKMGVPLLLAHPKRPVLKSAFKEFQYDFYGLSRMRPVSFPKHFLENIPGDIARDIHKILVPHCGLGGTAIGFALEGKAVHAVDANPQRLEMARQNAKALYHVEPSQLHFDQAEPLAAIRHFQGDTIFLDPPINPKTNQSPHTPHYSMAQSNPSDQTLLEAALHTHKRVILNVPINTDLNELKTYGRNFSYYRIKTNPLSRAETTTIVFHPYQEAPNPGVGLLTPEEAASF